MIPLFDVEEISFCQILDKVNQGEKIAVVVSARGNATDELEEMLSIASKNESYKPQLEQFKLEQQNGFAEVDFTEEFTVLEKLFGNDHRIIE